MVTTCPFCHESVTPTRNADGNRVCPLCNNTGRAAAQPEPWSAPAQPPAHARSTGENAPGAVASMVLGILGLVVPWVGWILGIIAWVLGAKARKACDRDPGLEGRGMATAGFVMGIISTVLGIIAAAFMLLAVVFVLVSDGAA